MYRVLFKQLDTLLYSHVLEITNIFIWIVFKMDKDIWSLQIAKFVP